MKRKSDKPSANEGLSPRTIKHPLSLTNSSVGIESPHSQLPIEPNVKVFWHYSPQITPELKALFRILLKGVR